MAGMREAIQAELDRAAKFHGVRILHAVESGSRVWGFESPNSDWDVRFIYVHPLSYYLSVDDRRDVIEIPLLPGDLDLSGWDLKKALGLLGKSNPPLLEWLTSPIVYQTTPDAKRMHDLALDYFNQRTATFHYLHMASGNYRGYLRGDTVRLKKYFYVLRPLLACIWIERFGGMPPVAFDGLLEVADWGPDLGTIVSDLVTRKKAGDELAEGPQLPDLNRWIESKLEHFSSLARTKSKGKGGPDNLNAFLQSILYAETP